MHRKAVTCHKITTVYITVYLEPYLKGHQINTTWYYRYVLHCCGYALFLKGPHYNTSTWFHDTEFMN